MTQKIAYKESIENMLLVYPCLKTLLVEDTKTVFSSEKINKIMGYEFVQYQEPITSNMINIVLNKILGGSDEK